MTEKELAFVILTVAGIALQLTLKYMPGVKAWYEKQSNKGGVALVLVAVIGLGYVSLACTPYAGALGIALPCAESNIPLLLQALFYIAGSQQLTYLYTR